MSESLGDNGQKTSPVWDTFDPAEIDGDEYDCEASGFPIWRNIRATEIGTLVFKCATPWKETIPGGSFNPETLTVSKTFDEGEVLEGVQIVAIVKSGSDGAYEVKP
jgi:hypothetical protein